MNKTKLGMSVGVLGAITYFTAVLGWTVPLVLIAGYILLAEDNIWLKKAVFKAVALLITFALLTALIGCIDDIFNVFNLLFDLELRFPLNLDHVLINIIAIFKFVFLAILGFKAFNQGDVAIPTIDSAIKNDD